MLLAGLIIVKVTIVTALGLLAAWLARGNRASIRHALLAATFGATLLLPLAAMLLPPVRLGVPVTVATPTMILPPQMNVDAKPFLRASAAGARTLTTAPRQPKSSLADLFLSAWAAGVALFLLPAAIGLWRIRSLRRSAVPWRHGHSLAESLALSAGIRRCVEVLLHEALPGPMTCGVAHPAILLPCDAETWNADDLNRAMIHELEHVRRRDSVSCCLAWIACAVYWFHPLIWIAWRKLLLEAERSCDDAVLANSEATAYADQLVGLARRLSKAKRLPALAMANRFDLAARVNSVLDNRQKRGRAGAAALILVCSVLFLLMTAVSPVTLTAAPQAASGKLQFEVASIRPITPELGADAAVTAGLRIDGAQLRASMPLRFLIGVAWKAQPHQFDAPEWMSLQWYEIAATLPKGHAKMDDIREMLQALLIERFHLKMHQENKDLPIYALTLVKTGITAKEDPLDPVGRSSETVSMSSENTTVSRLGRGATVAIGEDKIESRKFTMSMFADQLTRFVDRTVVDQTGLPPDAAYDLTLDLTHEDFLATRVRAALAGGMTPPPQAMKLLETSGDSLQVALAKLGIRLEAKKAPMEVLVIDSADKTPSDN